MKKQRNHQSRSGEPPPCATTSPSTPLIPSPTTPSSSSPLEHATPVHSKLILPVPIYTPVDHTKKSHARKQPAGHIPRPRNAFILFRCNFVDQDKIPSSVERDHRNISRIVGSLWRRMSDAEKEPWVRMADDEKRAHFLAYPGYRFSRVPLASAARHTTTRRSRGDDTASSRGSSSPKSNDPLYLSLPGYDSRRPASGTPGPADIPTASPKAFDAFPEPLVARDELARRPSRVMLSESACYEDFYPGFDDLHSPGDYIGKETDALDQYLSSESRDLPIRDWQSILEDRHRPEARSGGPRLNAIRLPIPGMDHPSQLDIVDTWDEYHAAQLQRAITPPEKESSQDGLEYSNLMMAHSIDLDLSPTLPPLPLSQTPESSDGENYYPVPASPIERKNSFYSPRSGTWKLPLPIISTNSSSGTGFTSTSQMDSGSSFADNLIDDELQYSYAEEPSGRTRASLSWVFDRPPSDDRSAITNEHYLRHHEAQSEHRDPWRPSLREVESSASTSSSKDTRRN